MLRVLAACLLLLAGLAASAQAESMRVVLVTHGSASERFWATIKAGAEEAGRDLEAEIVYLAPETFDLERMAALIDEAVASRPEGLVVSIPNADLLAAPLRRAAQAGIPVVSMNSGLDVARSLGALFHVGQSEYDAGRVAGREMRERGGRQALCINHEQGNVGLDQRCLGFIEGFEGSVEVMPVPPDADAVRQALATRLAADAGVDVVVALSATISGEAALAAVADAERADAVRIAVFDLSEPILEAVASGAVDFAVDQQPFLQGYMPVQALVLLRRNGVIPVSDIASGPRIIHSGDARRKLDDLERQAAGAGRGGTE